jgi:hypothetical protein
MCHRIQAISTPTLAGIPANTNVNCHQCIPASCLREILIGFDPRWPLPCTGGEFTMTVATAPETAAASHVRAA